MSKTKLIELLASAAIAAGVLRAIAAFVPISTPDAPKELLYLLTDIFILLGLLGLYGNHYKTAGKLGLAGFVIAIVGILTIRSNRAISGVELYPFGAFLLSIGLIILGTVLSRARVLHVWVVSGWVLSLCTGILAAAMNSAPLSIAAGLLFAAGFCGAGMQLYRAKSS